ncbi:MAG TPA: hypothetical protein VH186_24655 [Chloroflexia bacterium]|nr:hypothetical protein [Chloroflexia bacterium]
MADFQPPAAPKKAEKPEEYLVVQANLEQLEKLASLGVLTAEQVEAGKRHGGLEVRLPAHLVAQFVTPEQYDRLEIQQFARQLDRAGLNPAARLFLSAGRPLSFFGSQLLLLAQPLSQIAYGEKDPAGRFSRLLEDRRNVDYLLTELEALEKERRSLRTSKTGLTGRNSRRSTVSSTDNKDRKNL